MLSPCRHCNTADGCLPSAFFGLVLVGGCCRSPHPFCAVGRGSQAKGPRLSLGRTIDAGVESSQTTPINSRQRHFTLHRLPVGRGNVIAQGDAIQSSASPARCVADQTSTRRDTCPPTTMPLIPRMPASPTSRSHRIVRTDTQTLRGLPFFQRVGSRTPVGGRRLPHLVECSQGLSEVFLGDLI